MKRKNIACYMRRAFGKDNNGFVCRASGTDMIQLAWRPKGREYTEYITRMSSRDARLLAKRINQFLDAGG